MKIEKAKEILKKYPNIRPSMRSAILTMWTNPGWFANSPYTKRGVTAFLRYLKVNINSDRSQDRVVRAAWKLLERQKYKERHPFSYRKKCNETTVC